MNIRVGTWLEKDQDVPGAEFLATWQTTQWQEACHNVEVFLAQENNASFALPKGVYSEHISRTSALQNIYNELTSHWQEGWASRHKDFLLLCGLKLQTISEEETLRHLQKWLEEWLNFWASYQAIHRYCSTNYGDDEIDVVILARPEFRWSLNERSIARLYQKVCHLGSSIPERAHGYFWPPLNSSNQLIVQRDASKIQMIMGKELTIRQLFNPKNIKLYFCEHHQPLHNAMPLDTDPISCISRLLNIQWASLS